MKVAIQKQKLEYAKVLQQMMLTEPELRKHIAADLRWEKYADKYITEKHAKAFFTNNPDIFNGSMVKARHILVTPKTKDAKTVEAVKAQLTALKAQIEKEVTAELSKLPSGTDNLSIAKARAELATRTFSAAATKHSACPSSKQGGDIGWFYRSGMMVEPFARTAFSMKPGQVSDVVPTEFGYHLILVTDRRPGKAVKYEDVSKEVQGVYRDKARRSIIQQLRQRGKIVIHPIAR